MAYPNILDYLPNTPIGQLTVLDIGAGKCDTAISCRLLEAPVSLMAHLDVWQDDLDTLKKVPHLAKIVTFHVHNLVHPLPFGNGAFDVVVGIDVIEHLRAEDALRLLGEVERVAKNRVILFVPLGPCPSFAADQPNPYQHHLSVWWSIDLEMLGYTVDVFPAFHDFGHTVFDACIAWKDTQ